MLREVFHNNDICFYEHDFVSCFGKGCNFVIMSQHDRKDTILITAHYDGVGIYDNCGGVMQLLDLITSDKEIAKRFVFVFTDQEKCYQQGMYHFTKSSFYTRPIFHLNIDGIGVGNKLVVMPYEKFTVLKMFHKKLLVTDNRITVNEGVPSYQSFSLGCEDYFLKNGMIYFNKSVYNYLDEEWLLDKIKSNIRNDCYTEKINIFINSIPRKKYSSIWIY
jgi:hypothetical protein